ncbi:hypothetical protein C7999DRAFT_41658 [Corynascus novoguineensis]|uniref:Uncharacterized protein n=1 Tax=Corynascus novoguineensis TaxID=1126955 RepID=A0AAN7CRE9_9PEZI|nr:hypothetical protein C7999DRAFT_41658 [Corynascus novoguineensis]
MSGPNPEEIDLAEDEFGSNNANDYEVAEDAAMAATLGFSSFGGAKPIDNSNDNRPSKKRRFNPHRDEAVIAFREPAFAADRTQAEADPPAITDDITYADSEDDNKNLALNTTAAVTDPDAPPAAPTPSGLTTTTTLPDAPQPAAAAWPRNRGDYATMGQGSFPRRGGGAHGGRGGARGGRGGGSGGTRNPLWYVDYYDPSSNENPWEGMERFKGLEPVGTWLARFWDRSNKPVQKEQQAVEGDSVGQGAEEGVAAPAAAGAAATG